MKVAVIGGGAAGFFSAINVKVNYPDADVTIFEKSGKVLSKVRVSGGGRCNLTNGAESNSRLASAYPRGRRELKKAFRIFNNKDAVRWFESRGVSLMTQPDNCIFPESQDSQTIVDCFLGEARRLGIAIKLKSPVVKVVDKGNMLELFTNRDRGESADIFDKIIVATGGSPDRDRFLWIEELGHPVQDPVPSLFAYNIPEDDITKLTGIVVERCIISIPGESIKAEGSVLITHWGMSGPAILRHSSSSARFLREKNYIFDIRINWTGIKNKDDVRAGIAEIIQDNPNKILSNFRPYMLPERLWIYLLGKSGLTVKKKWSELGKKGIGRLINILTDDLYSVKGRSPFREEFVTCGGVALDSVDFKTMESKICRNLFFAGEVLDIDGFTGGYNLQAAWTTGFIAGMLK